MLISGALLSSGLANRNKAETGKRDDKATPFLPFIERGSLFGGEINFVRVLHVCV